MSCNFLQPRAPERGSDTLSEISESGTTNSGWTSGWDSREDLRDFVTKIGLKDVSDLHQDRFRVDRKKLEQMLSGDHEAPLPADIFFERIMDDTSTFITWPSKLKVGAKSKKDPHVRIAGRPGDVQAAKERILTVLDTRCNRVTMKMDVSYTDHSHIIGKGGSSIKRVMEETRCHVHFPDSNRSNPTEKSNQVSIAGDIQGVELARSRVRQKTPVIFGFELPIMTENVDPSCPYIIKIQEQYKVQILLRTRPKLHATLVLVKGVEWEVEQVKKATMLLVEYLCENLASQIAIHMSMEISPHHHQMVIGKNHSNIKEIMRTTGAMIMFPDAQDPNIPNLKKSSVTITGNIHNVYAARQLLIGSLPLVVMFDLPENSSGLPIRPDQVTEIQSKYDVIINVRLKAKQNVMTCIIKGAERSASNIYNARNEILAVDESSIIADIPGTYHMTAQSPQAVTEMLTPTPLNPHPMSPMLSPMISPTWHYPSTSFAQSQPSFVGMVNHQPQFIYNTGGLQHSIGSSGYHSLGLSGSSLSLEQSRDSRDSMDSRNSMESRNSLESRNSMESRNSLESRHNCNLSSISSTSSLASPTSSPRTSPYQKRSYPESPLEKIELSSVLNEMNMSSGYHGPTLEKRTDRSNTGYNTTEFEQMRMAGFKAMQGRVTGQGFRYPTNVWAGYGISHTSPAPLNDKQSATNNNNNNKDDDVWKMPTAKDYELPSSSTSANLNTSNFLDHTPISVINRITSTKWQDLSSLLTSLNLEKYIGLLTSHEIDLTTFSSITDKDLIEIGVTAFGARRKMLLAISELNKRSTPFSPAPGAERKSSSTSSTMSNSSSPREKW